MVRHIVPSRCARWNDELSADARDRTNRSSAFAARLAMQRMAAYRLSAQLAIGQEITIDYLASTAYTVLHNNGGES